MPAVPTLTLADNGDDTGAVATISGSTGGSTNDIYQASWGGGVVGSSFQLAGSRTGDGTIALALAAGYYWLYVLSTLTGDSAISLVKGLRVTTGALAVHEQCLDAAVAKIQALSLPSPWTSERVYKRKFPWNRNAIEQSGDAAIFVTPLNDRTQARTNQQNDFGLGCQITAAVKTNLDLTDKLDADLLCREHLMSAFLPVHGSEPLAGVSDVYDVLIEPAPVIDPGSFDAMYDVSAFVIRCMNRRNRGLA